MTGLNKKLIGTTYPWEAKYLFIQFPYIPIICLALFHQTKTGPCVSSNSLLVCHVIFPCWHVLVPYPEDMTYMPMRRMILCILLSLVESAAFWVYFIGRTVSFFLRCPMKKLNPLNYIPGWRGNGIIKSDCDPKQPLSERNHFSFTSETVRVSLLVRTTTVQYNHSTVVQLIFGGSYSLYGI